MPGAHGLPLPDGRQHPAQPALVLLSSDLTIAGQWLVQYREELPGLLHFPGSIGFSVATGELVSFGLPIPE